MKNKIKVYIGLIIGSFISILAIFLKGVNLGKKQQESKQTKQVLGNVKKAKKVINNLDTNKRNSVRKRYNRG